MSWKDTISRLAVGQAEQQKRQHLDFSATVRAIVDGDPITDGDVQAALDQAGKTLVDLESECARILKRRQLRKITEASMEAFTEIRRIEREIAEMDSEFHESQRRYETARLLLTNKITDLQLATKAAEGAEREMRKTADPAFTEKRAALLKRMELIGNQRDALKRKIGDVELMERTNFERAVLDARRTGDKTVPQQKPPSSDLIRLRQQYDDSEAARKEASNEYVELEQMCGLDF